MRVELTFDDKEWQEFVKAWQEPAVRRTLGSAASAWGRTVKPILKAETPTAKPGNKYASGPGNLQKLTRYKRIKARFGIGVVVAAMGRNAFYRRFVTIGTKPHEIKAKAGSLRVGSGFPAVVHHPGARPNDYVTRASHRAESAGLDAAERVVFDGLEAKRVTDTIDT